jgi:hypothetical protein
MLLPPSHNICYYYRRNNMIYYGRREYIITLLKQAMLKISEYIGSLSYNLIIHWFIKHILQKWQSSGYCIIYNRAFKLKTEMQVCQPHWVNFIIICSSVCKCTGERIYTSYYAVSYSRTWKLSTWYKFSLSYLWANIRKIVRECMLPPWGNARCVSTKVPLTSHC